VQLLCCLLLVLPCLLAHLLLHRLLLGAQTHHLQCCQHLQPLAKAEQDVLPLQQQP
jgi:hypothetical protein